MYITFANASHCRCSCYLLKLLLIQQQHLLIMRESIAKDLMNVSEVNSTWSAPIMLPSVVWYNDPHSSNTTTIDTNYSQYTSLSISLTRRPTPTLVDTVQLLKASQIYAFSSNIWGIQNAVHLSLKATQTQHNQ